MTTIFTTLVVLIMLYRLLQQYGVRSFFKFFLLWLLIFIIIIGLYSFRNELRYVSNRIIGAINPSYNMSSQDGEIIIGRNLDGHFYLTAIIMDTPIVFMIDTGASEVSLSAQDAKKLNYNLNTLAYSKRFSTAGGFTYSAPVKLDIKIGTKIFKNISGNISAKDKLDVSLLGMSIIQKFKSFKIDGDTLTIQY